MSYSPNHKTATKLSKTDKSGSKIKLQPMIQSQRHPSITRSPEKPTCRQASPSSQKLYRKTKSLKEEISQLFQSARTAKANISKGLQFVKLIDNFNQEQRCLQHNNVITLYCMNDKRLLCVYCIYGVHKHRSHKLLPPLEHLQYIAQDVFNLQQSFSNYLFSLEDVLSDSKASVKLLKDVMKSTLSSIEAEYMKRKFELEQLYEKQKKYVIQTCEQLIDKSQSIFTEFEQIKFNIWECQARYHLDKKVKVPNLSQSANENLIISMKEKSSQRNNQKQKSQTNKSPSRSPSKLKKQNQFSGTKQVITSNAKHQLSSDTEKDLREVMSKHVILSHIVEEMKNIQPLKIDQKTIVKRLFHKSMLKFLNQQSQLATKSSRSNLQNTNFFQIK